MDELYTGMPEDNQDALGDYPLDQGRLDSWGEIANYLGRSISTVQRWEKKEQLPVHRHLHEKADSVYAYEREIEIWRQSRGTVAGPPPNPIRSPAGELRGGERAKEAVDGPQSPVENGAIPIPWVIITVSAFAALLTALALSLYGVAILAFVVSGVFVAVGYSYLNDTVLTRTCVALFMIAAMSFIPSAWTMQDVMATVINIHTIKPAVAYPFVTGLRFIPLPILVLAFWVVLGLRGDVGFLSRPRLGQTFIGLGILFLLITSMATVASFGDDRIWREQLPGRDLLLAGYLTVFAANLAIGWRGYTFFKKDVLASYRPLFAACAVGYLLLGVGAVVVDWQYNEINKHYLGQRRSEVYRVSRPDAIRDLAHLGPAVLSQIGEDLQGLLSDPNFARALRTKKFYKQNFDEPFQVLKPAVMYGYQPDGSQKTPIFVIIRMPDELARALGFQSVGQE